MSETLSIVVAIFGLIGIGYAAARTGLLAPSVGESLTAFVFTISIPCLLFDTLATADMAGVSPWRVWAAYFGPFAIAWCLAHVVIRRVFGRDARAAVVGGGAAAYSNTLLVGVPLVAAAFGEAGTIVLIVIVSIHLPLMTLVTVLLHEWAMRADGVDAPTDSRGVALRRLAATLATNPIVIAIALGVGWRFFGLPVPLAVAAVVEPLARAAGPIALFAVGMSLVDFGVARQIRPALAIAAIKLVAMPALVFAAGTAIGLPALSVAVATLTAACPTGVNAFIIANQLGTGQALSSNVLLFSTAGGAVTVALWLALLQRGLG